MSTLEVSNRLQSLTKLYTLSGLRLEHTNFTRPKPLLLLAYLCIEGKKEKRFLAELFWPGASNHLNSLAKALSQLRQVGVIDNDDTHAWATVTSDVNEFLFTLEQRDHKSALALYQDSFLSGFYLPDWGAELEEWMYTTREFLAARAREAFLELAEETSDKHEALSYAQRAYSLDAASEPDFLPRLYKFLHGTPQAAKLEQEAKEFGVSLEQPKTIVSNLPTRGTSFIGREIERLELAELLSQPDVRLVTIVGQGGVGKTRLAIQVARELQESFPDGVVFFPVENLTTPEQMLAGLATALSVPLTEEDCTEQLPRIIGNKKVLLLMDSLEYQLESAYKGSVFLARCPNLKILVTSRARLNLEEEWVYALGGFALPEKTVKLEDAELNDAVALFVQRARKVKPGFALTRDHLPFILEICERVEGLPLGIELAASWLKMLSCQEVLEHLNEPDFLTAPLSNVPERQQSLRNVFEGSWQLLLGEEQAVLSKLSVFRGGFTKEAAREIAGATLLMLARLVDKSLLRVSASSRYDFHPLLHDYLKEKLVAASEAEQTASRHAQYFLDLAEHAKTHLNSAAPGEWLKQLDIEFANINTALTWLQSPETAPLAMRLVSALSRFWESLAYLSEGRKWAKEILNLDTKASPERAHLLLVAGNLALFQGDYPEANSLYRDSLRAWQTFGNKEGEIKVLNNIAIVAWQQGNYAYARQTYEACLDICRSLNDKVELANVTFNLGNLYTDLAEFDKAQVLVQESLRMYRHLGNKRLIGNNLIGLGMIAFEKGEYHAATEYAREGLTLLRDIAYKIGEADALNFLGQVACALRDYTLARVHLCEALEIKRENSEKAGIVLALEAFGQLEVAEGKAHKAVSLWAAATEMREEINMVFSPRSRERHERHLAKAREMLGEAFDTAWAMGKLLPLEQAVTLALEPIS